MWFIRPLLNLWKLKKGHWAYINIAPVQTWYVKNAKKLTGVWIAWMWTCRFYTDCFVMQIVCNGLCLLFM